MFLCCWRGFSSPAHPTQAPKGHQGPRGLKGLRGPKDRQAPQGPRDRKDPRAPKGVTVRRGPWGLRELPVLKGHRETKGLRGK
jgi:hypothetical protein